MDQNLHFSGFWGPRAYIECLGQKNEIGIPGTIYKSKHDFHGKISFEKHKNNEFMICLKLQVSLFVRHVAIASDPTFRETSSCKRRVVDLTQCWVDLDGLHENTNLGGGFKYFLFSSLFGEDSQFD